MASLVVQMVGSPSALQEMAVGSLGWEDSLEKGVTIHSSILAWRMPWMEEPGGLQSMRSQRVEHDLVIKHVCDLLWVNQCQQS